MNNNKSLKLTINYRSRSKFYILLHHSKTCFYSIKYLQRNRENLHNILWFCQFSFHSNFLGWTVHVLSNQESTAVWCLFKRNEYRIVVFVFMVILFVWANAQYLMPISITETTLFYLISLQCISNYMQINMVSNL